MTHADYFDDVDDCSDEYIERQTIKLYDRVTVPAWVDGLGEDRAGKITEIKMFMGSIFFTVRFEKPDSLGRIGIIARENQIIKT